MHMFMYQMYIVFHSILTIIKTYKRIFFIMEFLYVDITEYPVTREGIYQACYDEVVAEATDTGDLPMYGEQMLNQSAQWKYEEFMNDIEKMVGVQ